MCSSSSEMATTSSGTPRSRACAQTRMYSCNGGDFTLCAIYVVDEGSSLEKDGGFPEVMASEPGSDETALVKDAGKYYLDVSAANSQWTVTIEQLR